MGEVIHVVQLKFKPEVDIAKINEVCPFSCSLLELGH
jgi:hypothetical protein